VGHPPSITSLTNNVGAIVATYTTDTFGRQLSSTGTVVNPFRYTGREWEGEIGLYYYRARYYDANAGRFVSEDPIRFMAGDVNFYSYVTQDPINFRDPSGKRPCLPKDCLKVFQQVIPGFTRRRWDAVLDWTPILFAARTGNPMGDLLTVGDVVGGSDSTPINQSVPYGTDAVTIRGAWGAAVVIGPNAYSNAYGTDMVLLHEYLHVVSGWNDNEVFQRFEGFGLKKRNPGTDDITAWISRGCK
jgi:RHS repeat-associated protein